MIDDPKQAETKTEEVAGGTTDTKVEPSTPSEPEKPADDTAGTQPNA